MDKYGCLETWPVKSLSISQKPEIQVGMWGTLVLGILSKERKVLSRLKTLLLAYLIEGINSNLYHETS